MPVSRLYEQGLEIIASEAGAERGLLGAPAFARDGVLHASCASVWSVTISCILSFSIYNPYRLLFIFAVPSLETLAIVNSSGGSFGVM